jgi:hypothetical protein
MDFKSHIVSDLGNDVRRFLNLLEVYEWHSPNKFLWHLRPCTNHFETTLCLDSSVCASSMFTKNTPSWGAQHELVWKWGWVRSSNLCHYYVLGSPLTTHSRCLMCPNLKMCCWFYNVTKMDVPRQFWDIFHLLMQMIIFFIQRPSLDDFCAVHPICPFKVWPNPKP